MKILLAHAAYGVETFQWYREIAETAGEGIEAIPFVLTLNPPAPALPWPELDRLWKQRDRGLLSLYEELMEAAAGCDILLNYNGINIHPDFLPNLPTYNVFACFDDPENSANLSQPVAASYDAVFYGNIASRFQYESWGCKKLAWLPIFTIPSKVPSPDEGEGLLQRERDVDIVFVGGKTNWRGERLEALSRAFPQARCYGEGWESGIIDSREVDDLYRRAKIGWNVHNSTGPINMRLFALAAFGVLQICDNKTGLGQIFRLGEEVIGFDTIPEAIELTHYYLGHTDDAREIAQRAYRRFWQDYHPAAVWGRIAEQLKEWGAFQAKVIDRRKPVNLNNRTISQHASPLVQAWRALTRRVFQSDDLLKSDKPEIKTNSIDDSFYLGHKTSFTNETYPISQDANIAEDSTSVVLPDCSKYHALSWAVTALIGEAKTIVEIGMKNGAFAQYASVEPKRRIDCFGKEANWKELNSQVPTYSNVRHFTANEDRLQASYDLLVSLEFIQRAEDLRDFLGFCAGLAPRAIFSANNLIRAVKREHMAPSAWHEYIWEFHPNELYRALEIFYRKVYLYHLPDAYVPWIEPMRVGSSCPPIIAECIDPY